MKSFVGTSWVALLQADSGTWPPLSRGSAVSHGPESSTDLYIQLEDAEGERIIPEWDLWTRLARGAHHFCRGRPGMQRSCGPRGNREMTWSTTGQALPHVTRYKG